MSSDQAQTDQSQTLIFSLDEPRYALYLSAVERVVQAVETTPLLKAPEFIIKAGTIEHGAEGLKSVCANVYVSPL
jgi:chemotaxis signal transduction protein